MTETQSDRKTLWWLLLFAAAVRVFFLLISVNATSDGPPRAIYAGDWAQNPTLITHGHWLPLQLYLSGLLLMVWDNIWVAPRIVSLVFGVTTVWPFWRLTRLQFSREVSLAASFLFILYGLHIAQSVVASAEAVFLFVVLWAMYFFCRWWTTQETASLVWSALLWWPAVWSKPEAWWLAASSVLFVMARRRFAPVMIYGGLVALGPISWMLACWLIKGDPLLTFHSTASAVGSAYHARSALYKIAIWPVSLLLSLGPVVLLLGLAGLWSALRERKHLVLVAFLVGYVAPFWALQLAGSSGARARHTLFIGTLLLPFAAYAAESRVRNLPRWSAIAGAVWLVIILTLGETRFGEISQKFSSISPRPRERWHVTEVTDWVRQNAKPTDHVVVDCFNDEESSLQYQVRLPPAQVRIYWSPKQSVADTLQPPPRFVVCAKNGAIVPGLGLDWEAERQQTHGLEFIRRYTNEVYAVFEVSSQQHLGAAVISRALRAFEHADDVQAEFTVGKGFLTGADALQEM